MEKMFSHIKLFYKDYMYFASRSRIMLEMVVVNAAILAFIAYKISQIDHVKTLWTGGTAAIMTFRLLPLDSFFIRRFRFSIWRVHFSNI